MGVNLSDALVVGISATALFDLSEEDALFREASEKNPQDAVLSYERMMREREDKPLKPGTAYPLVKALLELNKLGGDEKNPLVDVVVLSRNSPATGVRVLNNIRKEGLAISRFAFTSGAPVVGYAAAFEVDLFLSTSPEDVQAVIDSRMCAGAVLRAPPEDYQSIPPGQVRIAFDGDAVLFSEDSELVFKTQGLAEFHDQEDKQQDVPLVEGPYALLLKRISRLQERLPQNFEKPPIRVGLFTARSKPAEMRVIKTLRHWGVRIDEALFLGGLEKTKALRAYVPHIFFDDQEVHLEGAAKHVPSGRVPYHTNSPLNGIAEK